MFYHYDAGTEEYLRPSELIGLDWIGVNGVGHIDKVSLHPGHGEMGDRHRYTIFVRDHAAKQDNFKSCLECRPKKSGSALRPRK